MFFYYIVFVVVMSSHQRLTLHFESRFDSDRVTVALNTSESRLILERQCAPILESLFFSFGIFDFPKDERNTRIVEI